MIQLIRVIAAMIEATPQAEEDFLAALLGFRSRIKADPETELACREEMKDFLQAEFSRLDDQPDWQKEIVGIWLDGEGEPELTSF